MLQGILSSIKERYKSNKIKCLNFGIPMIWREWREWFIETECDYESTSYEPEEVIKYPQTFNHAELNDLFTSPGTTYLRILHNY